MIKNITLAFSLLFIVFHSFGQKLDYDTDSRWFWGLNIGTTWQSTDVRNKNDVGWGLVLGKSYNYDYGKKISFDLRGRYLYGKWYGQDFDTTSGAVLPQILSSGNTNYRDGLGYSVLNFENTVHKLGLELVIHANGIRERTGWDPYIFGGVGLTWYESKTNQLFDGGLNFDSTSMYQYDQLNGFNKTNINSILDDSYETDLDGSGFNVGFMPSLGFGLGYQVGPRFSVGVEHKTTFTRMDGFDGFEGNEGIRQNDLYHYTSFYLRFQVRKRRPSQTDNSLNQVPNYENEVVQGQNLPPVVRFTTPATSPVTVQQPSYTLRADIRHVDNSQNINFRQNGNFVGNFSFNPNTRQFESTVMLVPGQNVFELSGSNPYGTDQKTTIIIYQRENPVPPIVNINNPATSPFTTSNPGFSFMGTVLNVQNQNQITLTVNGQQTSNFTFNGSNGVVNAPLNLAVGTNIVTLTGTNQAGSDSETTTIIYQPVQTVQPPVVYFVDPHVNPYSTNQPNFVINAEVLNVSGRQNITFKQNGSINQNFTFNTGNNDFQSTVILVPGQNVFEIIGSNSAGSAQATTIIIYERQAPRPPVVTITNPGNNPHTTENPFFVLGSTILNVQSSSQILVQLNGQTISNFNFNPATSALNANLNLVEGSNTIFVRGTNNDGTDSKQTVIVYRKPMMQQPPLVTFISPNVNPFTTNAPTHAVLATVYNVDNASGVNVNVNGSNYTAFSFNTSNKQVSFNLNLIEGSNVIVITGQNQVGVDSKTQTIIYRKPQQQLPPVVTFINPVSNPETSFSQTYDLKARVEHVGSAQNIQLRINGVLTSNFSFSPSSELMTFSSSLLVGANSFEITGTNSAGQDVESTTIIYNRPNPTLPPVVTITTPALSPTTVSVSSTPIVATVLNVDGNENISVLVNGNPFNGFQYNTSTKQLTFTMSLNNGSNTVQISATNTAGTASDSKTIVFKRDVVVPAPFVTYVNPSAPGTVVRNAHYEVKARITNIQTISQAQVEFNGQVVPQTSYSFNPQNGEVTFSASLNFGNNTLVVTGTNASGTHSASTNILFRKPEVACLKPTISFNTPAGNPVKASSSTIAISAVISNIEFARQVKVRLNGSLVPNFDFNAGTKTLTHTLTLMEGQNTIEIVATNDCGDAKESKTVNYKAPEAPCLAPIVTIIKPRSGTKTQETSTTITASTLNVTAANQLVLTVNGASKNFTFDPATHNLTATIELALGMNEIKLVATTPCGTSEVISRLERTACELPKAVVIKSSVVNKGTTYLEAFTLDASISGIAQASQITLTQNGNNINFVFDPQTNALFLDRVLVMGSNKFIITLTNACGKSTLEHTVIRQRDPNAVPPRITITNPASTPFNTTQGAMNVEISTQFVNSAGQVAVTVNGVATNFNFNAANGTISLNRTWVTGANVIVATAVTQYGTASDTKTVMYQPQTANPPVIYITNPANCPATLPVGTSVITGYVTNITDLNQVTFFLSGRPTSNVNPVLSNGRLNFSITLNMGSGSNPITLQINAQNTVGSDSKTCQFTVTSVTNGTNSNTGTINNVGTGRQPSGGGNGSGNNEPKPTTPVKKPVKPAGKTPTTVTPTTKPKEVEKKPVTRTGTEKKPITPTETEKKPVETAPKRVGGR